MSTANILGLDSFLSWITNNQEALDPEVVTHQPHSDPPNLLENEKCGRVYRSGRDVYVYTNFRLMHIDVQGFSVKKVKYLSLPLRWMKNFEVETAGTLDPSAEVYINSDIPSKGKVQQEILVKTGDVVEMHQYLTEKLGFSSKWRLGDTQQHAYYEWQGQQLL